MTTTRTLVSTWTAHPTAGSVAMAIEAAAGVRAGVASGSETGFDIGHVLHGGPALERCLQRSDDPAAAIAALPSWLDERFPYDGSDDLIGRESPSIDLVVAELRENEAVVAWVGAGQAWHVRAGRVIAETTRHTIRNAHAGLEAAAVPGAVLDIPSRLVTRDAAEPETARWTLAPGDRLLLLSACLLRRCPRDELEPLATAPDVTAPGLGAAVERVFRSRSTPDTTLLLGAIVAVERGGRSSSPSSSKVAQ
ncbi:MAG: hypothetical protein H6719_21715 [Sandaracinaceae bacterium]|nr:hypothetical protein [Sandaracinaceae bacterium]